ncbi:uncharacterized protein [Drosophila tropicalis]|uniref:uncharacterized protein n=1 Tax=Drosophila tropicalis TaxID=46794 RepID=UPI0035AB74EA
MWPKHQLLTAAATLIGLCCIVSASGTSTGLPLQPPPTTTERPQNVTTAMTQPMSAGSDLTVKPDDLNDSSPEELNEQAASSELEVSEDLHYGSEVEGDSDQEEDAGSKNKEEFVGVPGFLPTVSTVLQESSNLPTNGHGYIQFDINDELPVETMHRQRQLTKSRTETVNEVLYNLFPNGFSDIFRFSGQDAATTEATTEMATTTEAEKAVVPATTVESIVPSTSPASAVPKNQTYYSYQTTVTKEYRRELRPGHTEIIVEQISSAEGEPPFKDGTNHISRDELLRINRAAVDSPVLPSLLLRPTENGDDNETLVAAESAPIVILGEHESDLDEGQLIEDNQIAESHQHERYHQRLLPPSGHNFKTGGVESYSSQHGPAQEQQINVHIIHDDTLAKAQAQGQKVEEVKAKAPSLALDHYQLHSEQHFQQRHPSAQEAPSRQFLKSFKPIITGSGESVGNKAVASFHYEVNNHPPQLQHNSQSPKESDYSAQFVRPAAQLAYQRELSHHLQQQPSEESSPQSKLNTQAVPSPTSAPSSSNSPHSLVYVTLNSAQTTPLPLPKEDSLAPNLPSPHEYVSEAAAEPSQQHLQHAPAPKSSHSEPETQLLVKPNGYTFVEVQKSVNIHNKLITEKDGRLVEQHETIYHQPYEQQQNHLTPEKYVASALPELPVPNPQHNYVSLTKNPINVEQEYDSSPQEGAYSHATINLESGHSAPQQHINVETAHPPALQVPQHYHVEKIIDHPVEHQVVEHPVKHHIVEKLVEHPVKHQIVEKHIPIPYAVPQPVPVPVHVEHFVDRPYPVETIVEHPVPYPVETVVEKIVEKHVPVEVERIVEKPVKVEKIVEKFVDRPMPIPIHVPVAIHMPLPPISHGHHFPGHPNALPPWTTHSVGHIPPKVLQNYYTRMLKKLLPQLSLPKTKTAPPTTKTTTKALQKPPTIPVRGDVPKVATFSLADMRFDLRPPPPPAGSPWLQGARYIYNTLPADLATAASASVAAAAPTQMVKSYIGPVPAPSASSNEFDEFQRWRNGHTLKRSPDFGRNLHMEYGFKPPLVPSVEIDDKGNPLKQAEATEKQ